MAATTTGSTAEELVGAEPQDGADGAGDRRNGDRPPGPRHGLGAPGSGAHGHGAGAVPDQSRAQRRESFEVADFPVPGGREEEWRFTPLDRLGALLADGPVPSDVPVSFGEPFGEQVPSGEQAPSEAAVPALDRETDLPDGVTLTEVTTAQARALGARPPGDRAAVLAVARSGGALHLAIPADAAPERPIGVRLTGGSVGGAKDVVRGHLVVTAGRHSRSVLVLDHTGTAQYAEVLSVVVEDGAELTIVSLQSWDADAVHLAQHDAVVGRDARFKHVAVSLGGRTVRINTNVTYQGPGGDAELLGLYFADPGQHLEHRLFVDHAVPACRSNVVYKGALQGEGAHAVWVGDVLIRAAAEGTDTYELNRNLVLSDGARADSVPNLEIETGEIVGAGHASATGRFDDEQLFYLQARGIPEDQARRLVVRGFFAGVIQQIGVPEVAERLLAAIDARLEGEQP